MFKCYCFVGLYVNPQGICTKCVECEPGQYRSGCRRDSPGQCLPCTTCADSSKQRVNCARLSEGTCKAKTDLVRMPFCPKATDEVGQRRPDYAISQRQASGLGDFSFEQVFGTEADFACSNVCDGEGYDSIQCDGPFACNVKTCAERWTRADPRIRACPVVIRDDDVPAVVLQKRKEACVPCEECGHANKNTQASHSSSYDDWGAGCVRECSKLRCDANMVWDWTARRCKACADLRDIELCSKRDQQELNLKTRTVTGNWPLLYFPECEGNSADKQLHTFTYGTCVTCDSTQNRQLCLSTDEYPAVCDKLQVVCAECYRAGREGTTKRVDVVKGSWYNARSAETEPLHCQISACKRREELAWTGVGEADRLCTRTCAVVTPCAGDAVELPCRLPHDARCERVFPAPSGASGLLARAHFMYVDGEANLLNEQHDDAGVLKHRRFASFENTLVILDGEGEFQCVWNANGIFDNKASPAGLSNVLWASGSSLDDDYRDRGTKLCRPWDVRDNVVMPLLPLQNTISCSDEEDAYSGCLGRRTMVNTEAYVLSYRFHGDFYAEYPATPKRVNAGFTDAEHTPTDGRMLVHDRLGGAGRLFLMIVMHDRQAVVAVNVPNDRSLHNAAWLQSLLVTYAVVDLTRYPRNSVGVGLSVNVAVTVDDKHISDIDDFFLFESFWVQNVYNADDTSNRLGNTSSLFLLEVEDSAFNTWSRCVDASKTPEWTGLQVAPFLSQELTNSPPNHSWVGQKLASAILFHVRTECTKKDVVQPTEECRDLKDAAAVFVRESAYDYGATAQKSYTQKSSPCATEADLTCGGGCQCTVTSGTSSGIISTGEGDYSPDMNCWWLLAASQDNDIQISFTMFDTENSYDVVTLFECSDVLCSSQTLIVKQSGEEESRPPNNFVNNGKVYTSSTGFLKITFTSDYDTNGKGFIAKWNVRSANDRAWLCQPTDDRTLLGLLHVHQHIGVAPSAEQHMLSSTQVHYTLTSELKEDFFQTQLQQTHAVAAFGKCALLITTATVPGRENGLGNAILCVGANGTASGTDAIQVLTRPSDTGTRFLSAFSYDLQVARRLFVVEAGKGARSASLRVFNTLTLELDVIQDDRGNSDAWVSVCVFGQQIAALCLNNDNQLEVNFFTITESAQGVQLSTSVSSGMLVPVEFKIVEDMNVEDAWMRYSRVVSSVQTDVVLTACVTLQQVPNTATEAGGSRLVLLVCAGAAADGRAGGECTDVELLQAPDVGASFVSVAFLSSKKQEDTEETEENWVVGVYGTIFVVRSGRNVDGRLPLTLEMQTTTMLQNKHFVKVDPLFYTFGIGGSGASTIEVQSHLPGFERLFNNVNVSTAYAVVVVPASSTPLPDVVDDESTAPEPVLNLYVYRASYRTDAPGNYSVPVYERLGVSEPGDEFTQLLVSSHRPQPFATQKAGFLAVYEGSGLNHRVGLPYSYGRYEDAPCRFVDGTVSGGLIVHWNAEAVHDAWLLLHFSVPGGKRLSFGNTGQFAHTFTSDAHDSTPKDVVLVVDAATRQSTLFHIKSHTQAAADTLETTSVPPWTRLRMDPRVFWVNSLAMAEQPAAHEVRARLLRTVRVRQSSTDRTPVDFFWSGENLVNPWRRHHHVLTLNPVQNMRLELHFRRSEVYSDSTQVSVGVDDVQLAPVLSRGPPMLGPQSELCVLMYVPSSLDLQVVNLEHLVVSDHWDRLYVTIGLHTQHACSYEAHLYLPDETNTCTPSDTEAPGLQLIGCRLRTDTASVHGAYAECQLELPLFFTHPLELIGVVVRPAENASDSECQLSLRSSLVAFLRPHTALYTCPQGQFMTSEGTCANCHGDAVLDLCPPGKRIDGCPAVQTLHDVNCVNCTEGADSVDRNVAHWVLNASEICAWECEPEYFRSVSTNQADCQACSVPRVCSAGETWQECRPLEDGRCVQCEDLVLSKFSYAANEEYTDGCQTRCRQGFYNDTDNRCKRCWDRFELFLNAQSESESNFFAFTNCTRDMNALWIPCPDEPGSIVTGNDPGAGTLLDPFTGKCTRKCEPGWTMQAGICTRCARPLKIVDGAPTPALLHEDAFEWLAESCNITCVQPYLSTRARAHGDTSILDTCVLCTKIDDTPLCDSGFFPSGPYCQCDTCERP